QVAFHTAEQAARCPPPPNPAMRDDAFEARLRVIQCRVNQLRFKDAMIAETIMQVEALRQKALAGSDPIRLLCVDDAVARVWRLLELAASGGGNDEYDRAKLEAVRSKAAIVAAEAGGCMRPIDD